MSIIGILKIMEVQEDDMEVQEEAVLLVAYAKLQTRIQSKFYKKINTYISFPQGVDQF